MVGSVGACGRVAAVALLAVSSVVPYGPPIRTTSAPTPVADVVTSCSITVGTATTDAALASDAARALTAGYALTDCMPDASLIAAAEARAAIAMPGSAAEAGTVAGGAVAGRAVAGEAVAGGAVGTSSGTAAQGTATAASVPTTSAAPTTSTLPSTTTTTAASSTTTTTTSSSEPLPADGGTSNGSDGTSDGTSDGHSDQGGTTTLPTTGGTAADGTTAAGRFGWGQATRSDDFDGDLSAWGVYDGPGHAGKGRRSPAAMSVANGILTIFGDASGTTGGMAWGNGEKYGRWEARVRSPAGDPTYNAVMLLWPDAENWPVGGEVDFMEIGDETRQKTDFFLHYGEDDHQLHGQVAIDATQWHNWAVEWAPDHITAYVDGQPWYTTTQTDALPPGPMHLTLQLDWFPKGGGAVQPSTMSADWVRYYPITGTGASAAITNSGDGGAAATAFVGPQVAGTGQSDTGSSGDGAASVDGNDSSDSSDTSDRRVAGITATSTTTTVTRTASATASATGSGTAGTATASSPTAATTTSATVTARSSPDTGG